VKKRLRLLSEVVLRTVKRRLASSFAIFLQKKWRLAFFSHPAILNGILSLKTQNFAVKSNSENRFTFIQKNSKRQKRSIFTQ